MHLEKKLEAAAAAAEEEERSGNRCCCCCCCRCCWRGHGCARRAWTSALLRPPRLVQHRVTRNRKREAVAVAVADTARLALTTPRLPRDVGLLPRPLRRKTPIATAAVRPSPCLSLHGRQMQP